MVFLNASDWQKTAGFCQNLSDQGFYKVCPSNAFGIEFWKEISNTTFPAIGYQIKFLAQRLFGAPLHFPLTWYFWISGIDAKPLTFIKICLTNTQPQFGPCSFGSSSTPANMCGFGPCYFRASFIKFPTQHALVLFTKEIFCHDLSPGYLLILP